MEKISVENFLVIKKADFFVGNINIIIGPPRMGNLLQNYYTFSELSKMKAI